MRRGALLAVAAALLLAAAAPAGARARSLGAAPAAQALELVIPLVADDAGLRRFAIAVSTPGSPLYGDFQPLARLAARFGAPPARAAAVVRYLRAAGARSVQVSPTRMFVQATMTVAQAQRAFHTTLGVRLAADGARFVAPSAHASAAAPAGPPSLVALPPALRGLATGVVGLDTQPLVPRPQLAALTRGQSPRAAAGAPSSAYATRTGTATGCSGALGTPGFTPNQYLTAYGYGAVHAAGLRGAGERVALIEIDGFKASDVGAFDRCFGLSTPPLRVFTLGFRHPLAPGGESTLDLELLSAAAPKLRSIDVYEAEGDAAHVLDAFAAPLVQPGSKPDVVSVSLGICESFLQTDASAAGIAAIERNVELAAAAGITVLASAGDDGSSACQNADGSIIDELGVSYPASSPFVTAVGGTNFHLDAANAITSEQVWNDGAVHPSAGGGGFSFMWDRPAYQRPVVSVNARVVPDVSLLADLAPGYAIFCTAAGDDACTGWGSVGGTSAAAPLLAAGLALIDQDLHRHHRKVLGLANPLLYQLARSPAGARIFRDVTAFDNDLGPFLTPGGQPLGCCSAAPRFDAASGWGSVNLAALDSAALRTAPPAPDLSVSLPAHQSPLRRGYLVARLRCSTPCRANVAGGVILSSRSEFAVRSAFRTLHRGRTVLLHLRLTRRQEARIRAALAAHHLVYAEVWGVALDARGKELAVSSGALFRF